MVRAPRRRHGRGNIDHVVVGPGGVFTIETKSHAGRRKVDQIDPAWLAQACAQAKVLERVAGTKVQPLLVFSRAYLDRPVSRHKGVVVLPARMLAGHLRRRRAVLEAPAALAVHDRLARSLG